MAFKSSNAAPQRRLSEHLLDVVYLGRLEEVQNLIHESDAAIDALTPEAVSMFLSAQFFQFLLNSGWDIGKQEPDRGVGLGRNLLSRICYDETLVRWCLDHGASVQQQIVNRQKNPPLLEIAAAWEASYLHSNCSTQRALY